jgi:hypothetical protein
VRRILLNTVAVLSLAVCVAVCVLWVHSEYRMLSVVRRVLPPGGLHRTWGAESAHGTLALTFSTRGPRRSDLADVFRWIRRAGDVAAEWSWRSDPLQEPAGYAPPTTTPGRGAVRWQRTTGRQYWRDYDQRRLWIRYWMLAVLAGAWPTTALLVRHVHSRRARAGLCPACGYDLRATPDRCPECGTNANVKSRTAG